MIKIKVGGLSNSGKTTVALIIHKALTEAGIDVQPIKEPFDEEAHERTQATQERCIEALNLHERKVGIETVQLNRSGTWPVFNPYTDIHQVHTGDGDNIANKFQVKYKE